MKFGVMISPERSVDTFIRRCLEAKQKLQPDSVWLPDRLLVDDPTSILRAMGIDVVHEPLEFLDPFLCLAEARRRVPGVESWGIAVTDLVRRRAPDIVRSANTLRQIGDGELFLGFGAGEAVNLDALDYDMPKGPVSHMEEEIKKMEEIVNKGLYLSSSGEVSKIGYKDTRFQLWIGGQGPRMTRITGQHAHGWIPAWKMSCKEYAEKKERILGFCRDSEKSPPIMGMFVSIIIGKDSKSLFSAMENNSGLKISLLYAPGHVWKAWGVRHPMGEKTRSFFDVRLPVENLDGVVRSLIEAPSEMLADVVVAGNSEEVLAELWRYRCSGVDKFIFMLPDFESPEGFFGMEACVDDYALICNEISRW